MRTVNKSGIRRSVSERRAYLDCPCGEHRQSIDQLAHVQETPNGMEPSRSPAIASRKNRDYQRATGPVYRASFSTGGYRRLTLVLSRSRFNCNRQCGSDTWYRRFTRPCTKPDNILDENLPGRGGHRVSLSRGRRAVPCVCLRSTKLTLFGLSRVSWIQ